jgi:hypothetical protein
MRRDAVRLGANTTPWAVDQGMVTPLLYGIDLVPNRNYLIAFAMPQPATISVMR